MKILKTFRKIVKFTAFFFSIYFTLFSSISYAQNVNDRVNAPAYVQVTIPQELGTISNSYFTSVAKSDLDKAPRPSAGLIIHIQDAHGQLAAQKNIDQILEYLVKKYGFQTVFLEGGLNGKISPDLLRFFKDETKNEKVANQLLEDGRIEGADVFLLKSKGKVSAYGLESASLYRRNILAYREVVSEKKNSENFLAQLKKQIFSFGSNYFNPELNKFTKEWLEFQDSHTEALKHLMILDEYARKYLKINLREAKKQFDYPQLVRFFSIKDMERNYGREEIKPRIHSDLKRLKKWLAEKKLNPAYAQIFESLVNYSYSSLNPSFPIDVRTFLESFYAEAKLKGFSFSDYYVFMKYLGLLLLAQELESDRLFDEIKKMNVEILKSLAKTPEENSLVRLIRDYFLFKKLLALELTRDEFSEVIEKEKVLTPYILTSRLRMLNNAKIKASIEAPRELGDLFQSAMRFYALAGEREDRMFNNMLSVLDGKPEKRIILITGGFHSHGLETLFRGQGFSFIGVTPRMAEVESNKKYVEQMLAGASTVPAISAGKIPLLEIKRFMGEKDFEFQEQAIQQAIAASLGELMPTDMDKLINDLMAEYTVPSNPPVEIVASPEHYRVGPYQFKENSERLTQHFQDYLGYASRNLKPDQRVFAQQALKKLIAREDFRDLAARAAEEIIYEFIKRITGNPEPLRSLKSMATEVAADELGQMNTSPAYLNNFFLQGKLMIGYAVGGNRATSVTFREQAIQGREALSNYMASLEQLPQISVNQSNSLLQQMNGEPKRVLYFLDNVMENVFDLILIRWLLIRGHEVTLVAKSKEADNDVTLEDLKYLFALPAIKKYMESFVGSDKLRMIASGSAARGTDLRRATPELIEAWKRAEVIISKGEGNRITLEGVNKDVFHLLVAKSTIEVPAHLPKGFGAIELVPATKAASLGAEKKEKQSLVVDSNAVRSLLFQHINSLVTIPTLHVLAHKKVFELFGNKEEPKRVGLMTIAKQFNDDDPLRNLGNLYGAMRTLALQGWVKISGVDEITQYELTEEGWKVVMLAELGYFRETVDAISNMRHYHTYFRGPPTDSSQYALLEFKKLAALSKSRSEIADLLMSPVMVALGMPLFEEQKDGSIKEKDPSFFKVFDKETQTLNLDSIGIGHDRKFLDAAFQLLASKGLAEFVDGCENLVRLTPLGAALKDMVVSYGVTNSYLNFYAKLDDALFVNPEPLKIADDEHIDRVMDIWGSSGSHKPYLKNKKDEGILAMVEKIFNLPLDQQPKGIADMGCGDGKMLAEIVEYIIHHTKRGKHLDTHPLAVVAADHSSKSQGRAKATLKKIAAIPGVSVEVLFGDVTNPGQYDRDIQERFTARGFQVGAKDLLHTQMFLPHERRLQVKTREAARRIIREHLKTVNRDALKKILKISFLPDSENDLLALIERQLTVSYSDRGRLIPGIVAAADLIQFVGRWTRYASRGLIILDLHTPRPEELGADKLAAPAYWGTHWISQHIMPYQEHNLCLLLAGLEPQETVFYPSKSPHTVSLSNYLPSQIAKAASLGSERDQEAQLRGLKGRIKAIEFDLQFFEDLLEVTPFEFETYLESLEAKQISVKPADLKEIGEEIAAVNLEQTLELRQFTESEIKKLKARFNKISANNIFRKKVEEFSERLSTLKGITKEKGIEMMVFVQDHYRKERKLGHGEIAGLLSRKDKRPLRVAVISDWIRGTKRIPFKYLFRVKQVYDAIAASSGSQAAGASLGADENRGGSSNGGKILMGKVHAILEAYTELLEMAEKKRLNRDSFDGFLRKNGFYENDGLALLPLKDLERDLRSVKGMRISDTLRLLQDVGSHPDWPKVDRWRNQFFSLLARERREGGMRLKLILEQLAISQIHFVKLLAPLFPCTKPDVDRWVNGLADIPSEAWFLLENLQAEKKEKEAIVPQVPPSSLPAPSSDGVDADAASASSLGQVLKKATLEQGKKYYTTREMAALSEGATSQRYTRRGLSELARSGVFKGVQIAKDKNAYLIPAEEVDAFLNGIDISTVVKILELSVGFRDYLNADLKNREEWQVRQFGPRITLIPFHVVEERLNRKSRLISFPSFFSMLKNEGLILSDKKVYLLIGNPEYCLGLSKEEMLKIFGRTGGLAEKSMYGQGSKIFLDKEIAAKLVVELKRVQEEVRNSKSFDEVVSETGISPRGLLVLIHLGKVKMKKYVLFIKRKFGFRMQITDFKEFKDQLKNPAELAKIKQLIRFGADKAELEGEVKPVEQPDVNDPKTELGFLTFSISFFEAVLLKGDDDQYDYDPVSLAEIRNRLDALKKSGSLASAPEQNRAFFLEERLAKLEASPEKERLDKKYLEKLRMKNKQRVRDGALLNRFRLEAGLTLSEFGVLLRPEMPFHKSQVYDMETGSRRVLDGLLERAKKISKEQRVQKLKSMRSEFLGLPEDFDGQLKGIPAGEILDRAQKLVIDSERMKFLKWRKSRGLSRRAFWGKLFEDRDFSPKIIEKWENGQQRIPKDVMQKAQSLDSQGLVLAFELAKQVVQGIVRFRNDEERLAFEAMEKKAEDNSAEAKSLGAAETAFNQDVLWFAQHLGVGGESPANSFIKQDPFVLIAYVDALGDEEARNSLTAAETLAKSLRANDLLIGVWSLKKPSFFERLRRIVRGEITVEDIPIGLAHDQFIRTILQKDHVTANISPVSVSSLSQDKDLNLTINKVTRIKLNLDVLKEKGIQPVQVLSLIRHIAANPQLRAKLFFEAGFSFNREQRFWEVGEGFVDMLERVYAQSLGQKQIARAA